jgi:iron complex outermembrane receptor protein
MHLSWNTCFLVIILFPFFASSQETTTDSSLLQEVTIKAYGQNSQVRNIPAAINHIGRTAMERFGPASIVQAVNTTPGIRMEERSPGSYRFSIRGSSLRSPFGVRNVKVYFNDIPITDPGGHTYLNQLGYYNFNSIDVIKGPGSSFYGAGTGGVILVQSLEGNELAGLMTEYAGGSYGLQNIYGSITTSQKQLTSRVGYQHQQSNGYRNHSELKRDVASWNGIFRFENNNVLKATFLYGKLFYETPGALTRTEYEKDRRASRPGNAAFPGAETARASITQNQAIAGLSYEQTLSKNIGNQTVLYGMFTELRNPTIQNYGRSSEPHFGGRTTFRFGHAFNNGAFNFDMGAETQLGFTNVSIHKNVSGNADSLRSFDEIRNSQSFLFSQASLELGDWTLTAGASLNYLGIRFERFTPATTGRQSRKFSNQLAPRISLMKKLNTINIYGSVAKGFSPPTTSELIPTGGAVNLELNAERGINYDLGMKGTIFRFLSFDINAFLFALENTIVQRRTAGGGDFFVNAGKTGQSGVETYVGLPVLRNALWLERSQVWMSHTWHQFRYKDFKQLTSDFSGKRLPGTPRNTVSAGYDLQAKKGLLATITYLHNSKVFLNDANSEAADPFHVVGLKLGYQKWFVKKLRMKIFAGVDNLFDDRYSLGNDINGFGGRYFNAAAGRNYYAAIVLQLLTAKTQ